MTAVRSAFLACVLAASSVALAQGRSGAPKPQPQQPATTPATQPGTVPSQPEVTRRAPLSNNEVIEVRQIQEMTGFPENIQKHAEGFEHRNVVHYVA